MKTFAHKSEMITDVGISKTKIIMDLRSIGVETGDHLAVGLSFKSIGYVNGGPEAFIDALIEAVGSKGTLMMNAFTEFFYLTELRSGWVDYIYDFRSTKVNTGIVPETLRQRAEALRSRHPTNSIVAIGKFADYLTQGHDEYSNAYLPYSKLAEIEGKYLAIGIGERLVGFRHQAQYAAGLLTKVPWKRAVKYRDANGEIGTFIYSDRGGCIRNLPKLVLYLRSEGLVREGKIGMANALLVPAKESLEIMTMKLKTNPEINICDYIFCYWCRELERRMNLYDRISSPRYFQKIIPLRYVLAFINWVRERDNKAIAWIKLLIKKYLQ